MIETVLFDLDETLTDRSASIHRYAEVFCADFASMLGASALADVERVMVSLDDGGYRPRDELYAGLADQLPWLSVPKVSDIGDHWRKWFPLNSVGRNGVHETLAELSGSGLLLGIVTNGTVLTQSAKIEYLNLEKYVDVVVISEAVGYRKPEPEIFELALDKIESSPEASVFVGDHPVKDVLGASKVGLSSVWFEGGKHAWPAELDPPKYSIRTLAELPSVITKLDAA